MTDDRLELWFVNHSGNAGQACIYQSTTNVTFTGPNLEQLAWMVTGANANVWIRFKWSLTYGFIWIDQAKTETSQYSDADLQAANQVTLTYNQYGFLFSRPQAASPAGTLIIKEDASIPVGKKAIVGIGMSHAGTFAVFVAPNQSLAFQPISQNSLTYCITFGQYSLEVGDVITPGMLNPVGNVIFPSGVTSMTATLDSANAWTISPGAPLHPAVHLITYQAGVGVIR